MIARAFGRLLRCFCSSHHCGIPSLLHRWCATSCGWLDRRCSSRPWSRSGNRLGCIWRSRRSRGPSVWYCCRRARYARLHICGTRCPLSECWSWYRAVLLSPCDLRHGATSSIIGLSFQVGSSIRRRRLCAVGDSAGLSSDRCSCGWLWLRSSIRLWSLTNGSHDLVKLVIS